MCVASPPIFAPRPLRDAWGLHPPPRVGTRNRPALLRTRQAGTRAPSALLHAAGLPGANHGVRPIAAPSRNGFPAGRVPNREVGCGPASWSGLGARFVRADFGHAMLASTRKYPLPHVTYGRERGGLEARGSPIQPSPRFLVLSLMALRNHHARRKAHGKSRRDPGRGVRVGATKRHDLHRVNPGGACSFASHVGCCR